MCPIISGGSSGGGSITPPVVLTGTDPGSAVLEIHPPADMPDDGLQLKVFDNNGDLKADIDALGRFDVWSFIVQDPPNTGGSPGSIAGQPGRITISRDDSQVGLVVKVAGGHNSLQAFASGHGDILELVPDVATDSAIQILQHASQSANVVEIWDNSFDNLLFAVTKGGGVMFPANDPHVAGAWWDNAGTLTRSSG